MFLGENLILFVRISLTSNPSHSNKQQAATGAAGGGTLAAPAPLGALPSIYPLKSPQSSRPKLPSADNNTPLPEHETKHSYLLRSIRSGLIPTAGIETRHIHITFLFLNKPKFSLLFPLSVLSH